MLVSSIVSSKERLLVRLRRPGLRCVAGPQDPQLLLRYLTRGNQGPRGYIRTALPASRVFSASVILSYRLVEKQSQL